MEYASILRTTKLDIIVERTPGLLNLEHALRFALSPPEPAGPDPDHPELHVVGAPYIFLPHMSMLYGYLPPEEISQMMDELRRDHGMRQYESNNAGTALEFNGERGWTVLEVTVARTDRECEDWEVVARIPLSAGTTKSSAKSL